MTMSTTINRLLCAVAILLLAACAPYSLVKPERQTVGGVISVQPGMAWNKVTMHNYQGHVELWTLDGQVLNTLVFFTGVPDGQPLFTVRAAGAPIRGAIAARQEHDAMIAAGKSDEEIHAVLMAKMKTKSPSV